MTANRWGMHAPNAGFRRMEDFFACGFQNYTVLDGNADLIPEIRARYPDSRILVRAYTSDWHSLDPVAWADQIAGWANPLRPQRIELSWANEQNLAIEGHPDGASAQRFFPPSSLYRDINDWNLQVIGRLRQVVPWAILHYPAFASGHSDDQSDAGYVGLEICREGIQAADVLDCHVYWDVDIGPLTTFSPKGGGQRFVLAHNRFPDKPIFISEAGSFAINDPRSLQQYPQWIYSLYNYDYVFGATFFIWDSDEANQVNVIQRNGALVAALMNASKDQPAQLPPVPVVKPPVPPPQPKPPQPVQPGPGSGNVYVIQAGDTLIAIAKKFNVALAALIAANQITDPHLIRTGQRLVIPSGAQQPSGGTGEELFYTVLSGDTLFKIALQFNTTVDALMQANNITDRNQIRAGTKLVIPQG
jgi:LysM repeat protein